MLQFLKKHSKKVGREPGDAVHVGENQVKQLNINLIRYDENSFHEEQTNTLDFCLTDKDKSSVTWIDVVGINKVDTIKEMSNQFGWHSLVVEDVVNADQRAKIEAYDNYTFMVIKYVDFVKEESFLTTEQVSMILGNHYVVTFRETDRPFFNPLRQRIRSGKGRIRHMSVDYLGYALLDILVDHYFIALDKLNDEMVDVEEELIDSPSHETLQKIHTLKKKTMSFHRIIWPVREMIMNIQKKEQDLFDEETRIFFRDLYDHTLQIVETLQIFRESISNMMDLYLNWTSHQLNEVMKVLTTFASIFIPLTFIAGLYGMNFEYMPELNYKFGYPILLMVMAACGLGMFFFFKFKKWI